MKELNELITNLKNELDSIELVLKTLSGRLFKLKEFLLTEKFMDLSVEIKILLKQQLEYMQEGYFNFQKYYNVLNKRYEIILKSIDNRG